MSTSYWSRYWADQTDGGHRTSAEDFLRLEADEKLFHLGEGDSLLDFGCGSADLLAYFAALGTSLISLAWTSRDPCWSGQASD